MSFWSSVGQIFSGSSGGGSSSSAGIWGAILSGVSNYSTQRSARKAAETASDNSKEEILLSAELQDYYRQRDKHEMRKGLENYRQFSTLSGFAPSNYKEKAPLDALQNKPSI